MLLAFYAPHLLGLERRWGAAGLTISAGLAAWVEFALLRWALNRRIGPTGLTAGRLVRLWTAAAIAAAVAWGVKLLQPVHQPLIAAIFILGAFSAVYLGATRLLRIPQATSILDRMRLFRRT